ncbi:MAG: hypothetical protein GY717_06585 [Rhodobacteraceae bacterium]|nr:hypothetical protein [Paracoccaceae bacterium]
MEPEGLGTILGAVIGALAELSEPLPKSVEVNQNAPAEHRPLRFAMPDRILDIHPGELREIARSEPVPGYPALTLSFTPGMTDWFAETTRANVDAPMTMSICGDEVSAPVIREPILGGELMIAGPFDRAELDAMMLVIAGHVDCDGTRMFETAPAGTNSRTGGRQGG